MFRTRHTAIYARIPHGYGRIFGVYFGVMGHVLKVGDSLDVYVDNFIIFYARHCRY